MLVGESKDREQLQQQIWYPPINKSLHTRQNSDLDCFPVTYHLAVGLWERRAFNSSLPPITRSYQEESQRIWTLLNDQTWVSPKHSPSVQGSAQVHFLQGAWPFRVRNSPTRDSHTNGNALLNLMPGLIFRQDTQIGQLLRLCTPANSSA